MSSERTCGGFVCIISVCSLIACGTQPGVGADSASATMAAPSLVVAASHSLDIEASQVNGVWLFLVEPGVTEDAVQPQRLGFSGPLQADWIVE